MYVSTSGFNFSKSMFPVKMNVKSPALAKRSWYICFVFSKVIVFTFSRVRLVYCVCDN